MATLIRPVSSPNYGEMTQPSSSTSRRRSSALWRKFTTRLKRAGYNGKQQQPSARRTKTEKGPIHQDSHSIGRIVRLRALRSVPDEPLSTQSERLPTDPPPAECSESDTAYATRFSTASRRSVQCDGIAQTTMSSASRSRSTRGPAYTSRHDNYSSSPTRRTFHNVCGDSLTPRKADTQVLIATANSENEACSEISSKSADTHTVTTLGTTVTTETTSPKQLEAPVTLRDVLMKRIITSQTRRPRAADGRNAPSDAVKATIMSNPGGTLTPLQTRELLKAMDIMIRKTEIPKSSSGTTEAVVARITTCAICMQPKVRAPPTTTPTGTSTPMTSNEDDHAAYITEIASRCPSLDATTLQSINAITHDQGCRTDCCRSYVCQTCLRYEILREIRETWWQNISGGTDTGEHSSGGGGWLSCPVPTCNVAMTRCSGTVRALLRTMTPEEGERCMQIYATAEKLRSALQGMTPVPTNKEIRRGLAMHKRLVKLGCAAPLLRDSAPSTQAESQQGSSGSSGAEEREDVCVKRVAVDLPVRGRDNGNSRNSRQGGSDSLAEIETRRVHLPLFTHTLRLPRLEKECVVCAEAYHDFAPNCIALNINRANAGYEASQTGWVAAVACFPGDWTRQIYDFPRVGTLEGCTSSSATPANTEESQQTCGSCLATHIDTQLTLLGPRVAEHGITLPTPCPKPDCHEDHKLSFDQIRRLASPETFARYDRLVTLAAVCHEDGFRWCLRPGCESGAVYYGVGNVDKPLPELPPSAIHAHDGLTQHERQNSDTATITPTTTTSPRSPVPPPRTSSAIYYRRHQTALQVPAVPSSRIRITDDITTTAAATKSSRITCHACDFAMCYHCQTPWHTSLTCTQAATQRLHGDPQPQRTRDWLDAHTKRCPGEGCGIAVQKGEGCFHMSCSSCSAQFCWECLADWRGIVVEGRFRREGHREGCYFRGENAVPPTQIMGRTVERGLRRAGGLRR